MSALSAVYGGVARLRRSWYARHPASRVRLSRPVVSVGNMVVGGSGKTPVVAAVAAALRRLGHRPAILSRGYRRMNTSADVVVVSDGSGPLVSVEESGDEPQMLARELTGVPIVVSAERHRAGRLAIERFDSTVLILDDGFQHVRLERTIDLLVVSAADLRERVLPAGRLREPLDAAKGADAVLVHGDEAEARRVAAAVGVSRAFSLRVHCRPFEALHGTMPAAQPGVRIVAVAAIARPERFFSALRQQGYAVARETTFRDHHWFTADDLRAIEQDARALKADAVVTTAKDAVRIERHRRELALPWAFLPIEVSVEPAADFDEWLRQRL